MAEAGQMMGADWPRGGGAMGALIRAHDLAATALGPVDHWPLSLRAAVDLALGCAFPMVVLWGPELAQVYNDGYRALMGDKHPGGLGQPTRDCWPEVWHLNAPLYARVRAGETVTLDDTLYPITRHGYPEDAYFTLCYSPLRDEAGAIAGALVTVFETTEAVRGRAVEAERARLAATLRDTQTRLLEEVFRRSPAFLHVLHGPDFVFELANDAYYRLVGHRELLGRPAFEALPEAATGGGPERLARVLATGEPFVGRELPVTLARTPGAPPEERLIDLVYLPLPDADGVGARILGHGVDVTEQVGARRAAEAALRASEARQAFLLDLGDRMRAQDGADAVIAVATRALGERLAASRIVYAEIDDAAGLARIRVGWEAPGIPPHPPALRLADFGGPLLDALRAGAIVRVDDVGPPPGRGDLAALDAIHIRAALSVPLLVGGRFALNLNVHQDRPRAWTDDEVALVEAVAERTWAAVERARAEAALRASEERLAFLLRLADILRPLDHPAAILTAATRALAEHLDTDRAYFGEISDDEQTYVVNHEYVRGGATSVIGTYRPADFGTVIPTSPDEPVMVPDVQAAPQYSAAERAAYAAAGVGAYITVALFRGRRRVTMLAVSQPTPRDWTTTEVALVRETAERTWAAMEYARAEAALRESEARFRLMADAVPQIVWITDPEGRVEFFNKQWSAYTGAPYEPTTAAAVAAGFVHPDDAAVTMARFDAARRTGEPFVVEHRIRAAAGDYRWFLVRAEPYRDPGTGAIARWFGASVDIHDRRAAEAALRESEARLRGFAEASADTLWIVDAATGALEYLSPAYERLWGEPRDAALRDPGHWAALVHPDDRAAAARLLPRALAGEVASGEYRIVSPADGAVRWVRDTGFPIRDAAGAVRRVAGLAQDITADKAAGAERERLLGAERAAREEAEAAVRARDTFLSIAAHELRTPLTALKGMAQLLLRQRSRGTLAPDRLDRTLHALDHAADRLVALTGDLLDVARLRAGQLPLDPRPTDLVALVAAAVGRARDRAGDGQSLTLEAPADLPPVAADASRLEQVLDNLLDNALKYAPGGGAVAVTVRAEAAGIAVAVRDTGIGLPPGAEEAIFAPFGRATNAAASQLPGLGLGLYICRSIVERHGGWIRAASAGEGRGTTITFWLPTDGPPGGG